MTGTNTALWKIMQEITTYLNLPRATCSSSRDPLGFQRYAIQLLPNLQSSPTRPLLCLSFLGLTATTFEPNLLLGESLPYDEYSEYLSRFERYLALAEAIRHNSNTSSNCSWVGQRKSRALARGNRSSLSLDISLTVQEGSMVKPTANPLRLG
jgi:hypothetical protein